MASADGGPVLCDGPIRIQPMTAIHNIRKTDLAFIPTTGLSLEDVSSAMRRLCRDPKQ